MSALSNLTREHFNKITHHLGEIEVLTMTDQNIYDHDHSELLHGLNEALKLVHSLRGLTFRNQGTD